MAVNSGSTGGGGCDGGTSVVRWKPMSVLAITRTAGSFLAVFHVGRCAGARGGTTDPSYGLTRFTESFFQPLFQRLYGRLVGQALAGAPAGGAGTRRAQKPQEGAPTR